MKKIVRNSWLCIILLFAINGCSKDDLVIDESLAKAEFELPKGAPGSVDERIYNIYQKYGTYIFYEFPDEDIRYLWSSRWVNWYVPANLSENKKYVPQMIDMIERVLLKKFETDFLKKTLPYKIFLVDSLCKSYWVPESSSDFANMLSNGQNAFIISNTGIKSENFTATDWKNLDVELNGLFTLNYYSALRKPADFIATRHPALTRPIVKDPTGEDTEYNNSLWLTGHISGQKYTTYLTPKEDQDYADFVAFLTGTPATEIKRRLTKYSRLKDRALLLVPYLNNVVNLNVIGTQNLNCPDDKLPADYFDKLQ